MRYMCSIKIYHLCWSLYHVHPPLVIDRWWGHGCCTWPDNDALLCSRATLVTSLQVDTFSILQYTSLLKWLLYTVTPPPFSGYNILWIFSLWVLSRWSLIRDITLLQAIGDSSQGICNVVLYCVFTPTVLNYFMKPLYCCRHHGYQYNDEERLLSSAWLLSTGTRDSQPHHYGNNSIATVTPPITNR